MPEGGESYPKGRRQSPSSCRRPRPLKRRWVHGVAELRLISPTIESISAVIARSQIVAAQPCRAGPNLPSGFDCAEIAVLDWIAVEGHRLGRGLLPI